MLKPVYGTREESTGGCLEASPISELSQAEVTTTRRVQIITRKVSYSGTGWRWKGHRIGVFSICAENCPGLRAASPEPQGPLQPAWPLQGTFRGCTFSGDSFATGFCASPPPGFGAFWIALQQQTQEQFRLQEFSSFSFFVSFLLSFAKPPNTTYDLTKLFYNNTVAKLTTWDKLS